MTRRLQLVALALLIGCFAVCVLGVRLLWPEPDLPPLFPDNRDVLDIQHDDWLRERAERIEELEREDAGK
jgi:hypothetical protein